MKQILKRAVSRSMPERISSRFSFPGGAYKGKKISAENFHAVKPGAARVSIGFVDGGQACVYEGDGISLHLIRAYGLIMRGKDTICTKKDEYYALIETEAEAGPSGDDQRAGGPVLGTEYSITVLPGIGHPAQFEPSGLDSDTQATRFKHDKHYQQDKFDERDKHGRTGATAGIPEELRKLRISTLDRRLATEGERASPATAAGLLRRVAEIAMCQSLCHKLDGGDLLVLDGTLDTRFSDEREAMQGLLRACEDKKVLMCALSKSTSIATDDGHKASELLIRLGPKGAWYYHPVAEIPPDENLPDVFFVKLHAISKEAFRFDIPPSQSRLFNAPKVFSILAYTSKDYILPGYPYGLVKADRFARVSDREKEYIRTSLVSGTGALEKIESRDLHSVLDSVS